MTAPPATLGMALGLLRDAGAEPLAREGKTNRPPIAEEKDKGINESPERLQKIASTLSELTRYIVQLGIPLTISEPCNEVHENGV